VAPIRQIRRGCDIEGHDAIEGRFTLAAYLAWRERESERHAERRSMLPSFPTIMQRFGNWTSAVAQMHDWRAKTPA